MTIVSESFKNGVYDIWLTGATGITLRGCGLDRQELVQRLTDSVHKYEARMCRETWPADDAINHVINGE